MTTEESSPRIIVRLEGHEFYYPVSDIVRLFTGEIPKEEDGRIVSGAGFLSSCIPSSEKALVLVSSVSDDLCGERIR